MFRRASGNRRLIGIHPRYQGQPPPPFWRITDPEDLASAPRVLSEGKKKAVNASTILRDGRSAPVVVKALRGLNMTDRTVDPKGHRNFDAMMMAELDATNLTEAEKGATARARDVVAAFFELLYLEFLRGEPGVPELRGPASVLGPRRRDPPRRASRHPSKRPPARAEAYP